MDSRGIARGFLSLTAPSLSAWMPDERRALARRVNEYTAELVTRWPGRFGNFATLPLPDVESALLEASYALDTLNADGVVLMSNYNNHFLGHRTFEPLWVELNQREAVVFIHPTRTSLLELDGIPAPFIDFPFATTRSVCEMVLKGVLDRHPKLRMVLSHAGGFLPYVVQRFIACAGTLPGAADADTMMQAFRRFYLDTALSSSPTTIPSLKAFADPSHIVFGTDFPYVPGGVQEQFTSMLEASTVLTPAEHEAIEHRNAAALFSGRSRVRDAVS